MGDWKPPLATSASERKMLTDVDAFGWHFVNVMESAEEGPFSYTIGLWRTWQHPEIIITGLRTEVAPLLLRNVVEKVQKGWRASQTERDPDILEGFDCGYAAVPPSKRNKAGFAHWYYGICGFELVQLLWPDKRNRLPGDDDWDASYRETQQLLFEDS
ncbi:MAG TPA: DUF4262 domain-containing protein [Myxococcales bacterium]|jgi:hypothetical protein|nr:DUF4262 domain-containing protein [Myxococcales bacterium]